MYKRPVGERSDEAMESEQLLPQQKSLPQDFNPNRLNGSSPEDIKQLISFCSTPEGRKKLLEQNALFSQSITMAIAAKNKADYPPLGPTNPYKKSFQTIKIDALLKAYTENNKNSGSTGVGQSAMAGFNTIGTWGANAARGTQRAVTAPSSTASSVGKSLKGWFGMGGRKKKRKRGTRKAKK